MAEAEILGALFAAATGLAAPAAGLARAAEPGPRDLWPAFLARLAAAARAEAAALELVQRGRVQRRWQAGHLAPPELPAAALQQMRAARVYSQVDLPGLAARDRPLRALRVAVGPETVAVLWLLRAQADFRAVDGLQLAGLMPYLAQALSSWQQLAEARGRAALDRQMAARLGADWLILGPGGRVLEAAPGLRSQRAGGPGPVLRADGWLTFGDPAIGQAYAQAVAAVAASPGSQQVLDLGQGVQLVLRDTEIAGERQLLGLLRRPPAARALPVAQVMQAFGLARSEARLAVQLADGLSLQEAAAALGWSIETTRTCSKKLFARLGVSGQPGVVRRLLESALWLAASAE